MPTSRRRPRSARTAPDPQQELIEQFGQALRAPHPSVFLEAVSAFATAFDAEGDLLDLPAEIEGAPGELLIELLRETRHPTVDAIVAVLRAFAPTGYDDRFDFGGTETLPVWLRRLDEAVATRAVAMVDLLGDADDVAVEVRLADGSALTMMALVDHNLGSRVKDAFVLPEPLTEVIDFWHRTAEPGSVVRPLLIADAGARLREALDEGEDALPLPATDTWPFSRALLAWVMSLLPDGGDGWTFESWSAADLRRLEGELVADIPSVSSSRQTLALMLRFAAGVGLGDPLRWSPISTEVFLTAWLVDELPQNSPIWDSVTDVLDQVIRFVHRKRKVPASRTRETLAVVADFAPLRQRGIDSAVDQLLMLNALAELTDAQEAERAMLELQAGGADRLQALDTLLLPDEPLDLSGLDPAVEAAARSIGALVSSTVDAYFLDPELRTAALRLLSRLARADALRTPVNQPLTAAAVVWIAAKANDAFGPERSVKGMTALLGVTQSPSTRAIGLLAAIGVAWQSPLPLALQDPALLTSARRAAMIAARDRLRKGE